MRLGGPVFGEQSDPEVWVAAVRAAGYRAAYCPVSPGADETVVNAYARRAEEAGIVIAEVGVWSNPLSPDEGIRQAALEQNKQSLDLADRINARCCVNIAGSRGAPWDAPDAANLTEVTFELIVETVREIIDVVNPRRSFYTLEPMPWMYPDSPDSYLRLMQAIDRPAFAAHLDPVNMICSPQLYYNNAAFLKECFAKLGPYIKSCHGKDILLRSTLTVHLDEVRPGLGQLDYSTFLHELAGLDDVPLMLEHLPGEDEYKLAAAYILSVAAQEKLPL
ncbi:MAG TPA: TIM barrel protein [Aggregatilineaceae bacterium]|nr:TIM barrel protein [Aggregatilineaceae bacterium]